MKKLLKFLNDSILIFAVIFIVIAAFMATYALSPVAFEKSILAENSKFNNSEPVLGENEFKYLEFENIYKEHEYFSVNGIPVNGDYKATIKLGPVSAGELSKPIVKVHNPSSKSKKAKINFKFSQADINIIKPKLIINGQVYDFSGGEKDNVVFDLVADQTADVNIQIEVLQRINYPLNLELTITM